MTERELTFLVTGVWIGTACGVLLVAVLSEGKKARRSQARAFDRREQESNGARLDFEEFEAQAAELNHGFTNREEIRS